MKRIEDTDAPDKEPPLAPVQDRSRVDTVEPQDPELLQKAIVPATNGNP